MIELSDGRIVEPVMDMRGGGSMEGVEMGSGSIERSSIGSIGKEGMAGIHIMPNGVVMTGTGETVEDATVTDEGMIELGSGETVKPVMDMRGGEGITRGENTMVVNENFDRLPVGCERIEGEKSITVTAGVENAEDFPGTVFTFDTHSINVEPCTRTTVTFINKDDVRHQFMVHDLPRDTYTMGMFNIEVTGPGRATGPFLTPPDKKTLMIHCGVPGHEEKGMKAQMKVDGGDGDLPNIPTVTRDVGTDAVTKERVFAFGGVGGFVFGALLYLVTLKRRRDTLMRN